MTGTTNPPVQPRKRTEDTGPLGMIVAWWHRYGYLIMGVWLLSVSIAVVIIALQVRADQVATKTAARTACERAREFAPRLIDDYEARGIFSREDLAAYRRSIPKTCPSK